MPTPQQKYYERNKDDPEYREKALEARRRWLARNKDNDEYKAKKRAAAALYYEKHKSEVKRKAKQRYREHGQAGRTDSLLLKKYGLSRQEYFDLLASQNYACAACGTTAPEKAHKRGWHVDHCHSTGKVRGILCGLCNVGIGHAKDDVKILQSWIDYLNR